jgi:uncharacterized iron-regulated membrane protein
MTLGLILGVLTILLWVSVGVWLWWDSRQTVRRILAEPDPERRAHLLRFWREC